MDEANFRAPDLRPFRIFLSVFRVRYVVVHGSLVPIAGEKPPTPSVMFGTFLLRLKNLLTLQSSMLDNCGTPRIEFLGGDAALAHCAAGSLRIPAHTYDYDQYRKNKEIWKAKRSFVTFIDQDVPYHLEYAARGMANPIEADGYFASLRKCLALIEFVTGLPVVVAAHPRSNYEAEDPRFGGRAVILGDTPQLIASSALVVTHGSTAVNFAVILRKPLLFVLSDEMLRAPYSGFVQAQASGLGTQIANMDRLSALDIERALACDAAAYRRYNRMFVRSGGAPDAPLWEQVSRAVRAKLMS